MKLSIAATLSAYLLLTSAQAQTPASSQEGQPVASASVQQVVAPTNQDTQWQVTSEQRGRVVQDVLAYLAAKDERRFADAYTYFAPSQRTAVSFDRWETDMRAFYSAAGQAQGRTLNKITWYKNPANAQPGIYATVDFSSRFAELSLHCGFVALRQQMDGSFAVVREEENSIPKKEMAKLTPEALQRIRAQYRC